MGGGVHQIWSVKRKMTAAMKKDLLTVSTKSLLCFWFYFIFGFDALWLRWNLKKKTIPVRYIYVKFNFSHKQINSWVYKSSRKSDSLTKFDTEMVPFDHQLVYSFSNSEMAWLSKPQMRSFLASWSHDLQFFYKADFAFQWMNHFPRWRSLSRDLLQRGRDGAWDWLVEESSVCSNWTL